MITVFSFFRFVRFDDESGGSNNEKERFARYGVKLGEKDLIGGSLWDSFYLKKNFTPVLFPTLSFFLFSCFCYMCYTSFYVGSDFWSGVLVGWFHFQVSGRRSEFCR